MTENQIIYKIIESYIMQEDLNYELLEFYAKSLNKAGKEQEAENIYNLIGTNKTKVTTSNSKKDFDLKILKYYKEIEPEILNEFVNYFEEEETDNLILGLKKNMKQRIKPMKILIEGRAGTGKTTFVQYLALKINSIVFKVSASNLVSSYLGDTQKNIDFLLEDIKKTKGQAIIIIDEIDSIIGNRENGTNDEYKRMIGSLNLMLDEIPNGATIFGITNKINQIDSAIIRRFNMKIELNTVSINNFMQVLERKLNANKKEVDLKLIEKILSNSILNQEQIENEILTLSLANDLADNFLFFNKNIYLGLEKAIGGNISENSMYEKGFNFAEIAKIVNKDQRTVKKIIESDGQLNGTI